jgi:hypothetical protein
VVTVGVAPADDSGRVVTGIVLLLLFGAGLILLIAMTVT